MPDEPPDNPKPKEKWSELALQDRLIVLLTAGIFLLTGVTAYIFLRQADIFQGQLAEMQSAGGQTERLIMLGQGQLTQNHRQVDKLSEQVTQFSRAAAAAEQSNKITQKNAQRALQASIDNSRLDERPWVLPTRFDLSAEPEEDKPITIRITVQNTGKTPALDQISRSIVLSWDVEPPITNFGPPPPTVVSKGMIPPGFNGLTFTTDPLKLNSGQVAAYKTGPNKIYLHARIDYRDSFTATTPHWTTICVYHQFGKPLDEFSYCQYGNDVDH